MPPVSGKMGINVGVGEAVADGMDVGAGRVDVGAGVADGVLDGGVANIETSGVGVARGDTGGVGVAGGDMGCVTVTDGVIVDGSTV